MAAVGDVPMATSESADTMYGINFEHMTATLLDTESDYLAGSTSGKTEAVTKCITPIPNINRTIARKILFGNRCKGSKKVDPTSYYGVN